jgi:hypothetical protein
VSFNLSILVMSCVAAIVAAATMSMAGEPAPAKEDPNVAMMEEYTKASKPGEMHRKLDPLVGEWSTKTTAWMAPGAPPTVTTGCVRKSWTHNGRFVREELSGVGPDGKPYTGTGYLGFDNGTKKYQGVWMSDMMTGMIVYSGVFDPATKSIACAGQESNPMDGSVLAFRCTTVIESADRHTLTYTYVMPDGKEMKAFVIEHTRK